MKRREHLSRAGRQLMNARRDSRVHRWRRVRRGGARLPLYIAQGWFLPF